VAKEEQRSARELYFFYENLDEFNKVIIRYLRSPPILNSF